MRKVRFSLVSLLLSSLFFAAIPSAHAAVGDYLFTLQGSPLTSPHGVAVDPFSHNIIVADSGGNRVVVYSQSGSEIFSIPMPPPAPSGGFPDGPMGVAVNSLGEIFVADTPNNRILVFNYSGQLLRSWGSPGNLAGEFNSPVRIAVGASGEIYVSDQFNSRVQVFDSQGNVLRIIPVNGMNMGLALDGAGRLYVSTAMDIQVFNPDGTPAGTFFPPPVSGYSFGCGLAMDGDHHLYTNDEFNNRILLLDTFGNVESAWGTSGIENGQFDRPNGIAVDDSLVRVVVVDGGNNRVQVFSASGGGGCVPTVDAGPPRVVFTDTFPVQVNLSAAVNACGQPYFCEWFSSLSMPIGAACDIPASFYSYGDSFPFVLVNFGAGQVMGDGTQVTVNYGDTTPDQFSFQDQMNVQLNATLSSGAIVVTGMAFPAPVSIAGGEYSINGGAGTTLPGTVGSGDTVAVTLTSSGDYSITTDATLTIGGVSDTFSVTTIPLQGDTPPSSAITAPTSGATLPGNTFAITGTALPTTGSGVQMVEVGITPAGGETAWYVVTGTTSWSFDWALPASGDYTIQSRATDSEGRIETPGAGVAVTANLDAWSVLYLDGGFSNGTGNNSIATDADGHLHIAYFVGEPYYDLRYATNKSGSWVTQTIDSVGIMGWGCSIAVDSRGKVHIGYVDSTGNVKYASDAANDSGWFSTMETIITITDDWGWGAVGSTSIAVDSNGKAHLCFYDSRYNDYIWYSTNKTGVWTFQQVDNWVRAPASLKLDTGGFAHVCYTDYSGTLKYATNKTGAWVAEALDGSYISSLALDGGGNPHLGYESSRGLIYAKKTSGSWEYETVDAASTLLGPTSIALDASGKAHLSYRDRAGGLRYATNAYGSWLIAAIPSCGGWSNSIALDGNGKVHISSFSADSIYSTGDSLYYATNADIAAPVSSITSPADGATLSGESVAITGTAEGPLYGLLQVEVGITPEGGETVWYQVAGGPEWSHAWTLPADGVYTLQSRATNMQNRTETPGPGVRVTVARLVPQDCVVSDWSPWSDCSATCGGGTQTGSRQVVTPAANGGAACPTDLVRSQGCNTDPCYVPLAVTVVGSGTVHSAPAPDIDCGGGQCQQPYAEGTPVTLSASAGAGYALSAWAGCDSFAGLQCGLTMDGARSVTATFAVYGITTASPLANATVGSSYGRTITATGGVKPYAWSVAGGSLPPGLGLNAASGVVSGTPTAAGSFDFTVRVADSYGSTAMKSFRLQVVIGPLVVSTASPLANATVGSSCGRTLYARGGIKPYTWSVVAGSLPPGFTLNAVTGVIRGTAAAAGKYDFTVQVADGRSPAVTAEKDFSLQVVIGPLAVTTVSPLANATVGSPYGRTLYAGGGIKPYTWSIVAGGLPPGFTLNAVTGVIRGTPAAAGSYDFTVQVADGRSPAVTAVKDFSMQVVVGPLAVTTLSPLADAVVGSPYGRTLYAGGGIKPYTWSVVAGSLPPGFTLNAVTGVIRGTPAAAGKYEFTVQVADSRSPAVTAVKAISLQAVIGPLVVTTASPLANAVIGSAYGRTLIASGGIKPYGWSVVAGSLPPGFTLNAVTGVIRGIPAAAGSYDFTVRVTDGPGTVTDKGFRLTSLAP